MNISTLMKAHSYVASTVNDEMLREIEYFDKHYEKKPKEDQQSVKSDEQQSASGEVGAEMFVLCILFVVAIIVYIFY